MRRKTFGDMDNIKFLLCIAAAVLTASCQNGGKTVEISGHIVEINGYGQAIPDFTPADMKAAGFDYGDLIEVTIGDDIHLTDIPFVTSFNEVAILAPSYVDYNAKGNDYGFSMLNGDFHRYIGGNIGDKCTMRLSSKGGYLHTYEMMKSVYTEERREGETDEEYANFRKVETTGIAPGVLYRSSNPLNCVNNAGRYAVADRLAEKAGIKTEIDLADTAEKLAVYMSMEGYASTYCPALYKAGCTIACGMMADSFSDDFKSRMGDAMRFIIDHEPPYLIHCNEGKDRCGFVSMVLEALAGAGIEEIRRDYMITMLNFYRIPDRGESYNLRQSLSIDRMVWLMCNEEALRDYRKIDWKSADPGNADLQSAVEKYLGECGLDADECAALKSRLQTPPGTLR